MDILSVLLQQRTRSVGLLIPDVVITESHKDELEIATHPVEAGANISDHAWKKPSTVIIDCGFSGGGTLLDFAAVSDYGLDVGLSPKKAYEKILDLQKRCELLDVVTGKRTYSNMLIQQVDVTSSKENESVLIAKLTLTEVFLSRTESTTVAEKSAMAQGVSTSAMVNTGQKSLKPVNNSSLAVPNS
ncbi:phage baseplate protein [Enterobacter sp. R1(2018)]|uniref:phage baseplate protein n=1 Tax=Enterobacter sp. R1(2018) TaxID=2447891 RepID=UPI000EAECB58|nr:hypothetical protein [Enterobacter sp. R1(2018)]RKQ40606.1 hypothetical protein D8M09_05290 [Enterobacter sp. R1(2018)]